MTPGRLKGFIRLAKQRGSCSYNEANKDRFHKDGKAICRKLATLMGLDTKERDVRSNMGGIAVSGEIMLHTDGLYLQLSQSCVGQGDTFMFRKCDGRKDYTGGRNRWMKFDDLTDLEAVAKRLKIIHDAPNDQMADINLREAAA